MVLYMSFLADNATSPLREVLLQHNRDRRYWLYYHTPPRSRLPIENKCNKDNSNKEHPLTPRDVFLSLFIEVLLEFMQWFFKALSTTSKEYNKRVFYLRGWEKNR